MLLVGAGFAALIAGLHALRNARPAEPELLRKLLHIGMGTISLSLPWLFDRPWPVLFLAALFVLGLVGGRFCPHWRRVADGVIYGVHRASVGDLCFPIAVAAVFLVSAADPVTFWIPILTMTLADAAAALIGLRCGTHRFGGAARAKTLEGSAAFFAVALPCTFLPLWCWTGRGVAATLLLSLNVALPATLVEALSARGLDNLTVPCAVLVLLHALPGLDGGRLAACLVALTAVLALLTYRRVRTARAFAAAPEVVHESV
jgi:phytol kinase